MKGINNVFRDNMVYYMELRHKSQADIARGLNVSTSTVSDWINGVSTPRADRVAAGLSLTFHNLRALNASAMLAMGVPDKYAMERGGWKTPAVMKRHYQNTLDAARRQIDEQINGHFEALFRKI